MATLSHWASMAMFLLLGMNAYTATGLGACIGAVVNYFGQAFFVFSNKSGHRQSVPRYLLAVALNWILNLALFTLFFAGFSLGVILSQALTTLGVALISYWLYKAYVFR